MKWKIPALNSNSAQTKKPTNLNLFFLLLLSLLQDDENEAFASLFANTLLNDDFSKDTDFDCLGLDNLQLNYASIPTTDDLNVSSGLQFLQISSAQLVGQPTAIESELQVIRLSSENTNRDTICEQILNEFNIASQTAPVPLIDELKTPTPIFDLPPPIKKKDLQDDDLFKKPSNDFLAQKPKSLPSSGQHFELVKLENLEKEPKKQIIILANDKNKKDKGAATASSSKLEPSKSSCNFTSFLANSSSMNKLLSLKRSRKRSKLLSGIVTNASMTSSIGSSKADNCDDPAASNAKSSQNKKLAIGKQNKFNASSMPLNKTSKKVDKSSKEKIKQIKKSSDLASSIQLSSASFEPLTKKLAVDSESSFKLILGNKPMSVEKNSPNKKDEFELDIKELSLFDSSEDDSNEMLLK